MINHLEDLILTIIVLLAAGISPNLYVVAQAGYAKLSTLAVNALLPSVAVVFAVLAFLSVRGYTNLLAQIGYGLIGGLLATIGLEVIRHTGFVLGGMPGEMPKLMGVLLLDRFAQGPTWISNLAGWGYHFWNGATFGIVITLLFGKPRIWQGTLIAILIGIGFMVSPATTALGIGLFGLNFNIGFPLTVILAHLVFGFILGWYLQQNPRPTASIFQRIPIIVYQRNSAEISARE